MNKNKNNIVVQIVLYSVLALVLISILSGFLGHGRFRHFGLSWFGQEINPFEDYRGSYSSTQIIKSEDVPADQLAALNEIRVEMSTQDIVFVDSTDGQIHMRQYGKDEKSSFTTSTDNGVLTIQGHEASTRKVFKFFGAGSYDWQRIEIALPDSYTGDLTIRTSAGDTSFDRPMKLKNLTLNCSAGTFESSSSIECDSIQADISAGTIEFYQLTSADYSITATTGEIDVDRLYGGGKIGVTMGEIDAGIYGITGEASFEGTLGDISLSVQPGVEFLFSGSKTVGDFDTNFPCQVNGSSVTAKIGDAPENQLSASITAGNVSVEIGD